MALLPPVRDVRVSVGYTVRLGTSFCASALI